MCDCAGFEHSSFVFAQEANMHENRFNEYRIPSGMLIVFLEKALTLIHMETHLDDVSAPEMLASASLFALSLCLARLSFFTFLRGPSFRTRSIRTFS